MSAYPLLALPSWDARTRAASVRVTAIVHTSRGLRSVTAEAATESDATAAVLDAVRRIAW